ncbi:MAG: ABC transporter ATP-binding protein [Cyanobacteria bacterium P01_H01_bin.15]
MASYRAFILGKARQHIWLVLLTVGLGFVSAVFNGIGTTMVVPLVLELLGDSSALLEKAPPLLKKIYSAFDGFEENWRLFALTGSVFGLILMKNVTNYAKSLASFFLHRAIANRMRLDAVRVVLETDIDFFAKNQIGDLVNRLGNEINRTAGAVKQIVNFITIFITLLTFLALLITLSWQVTLLTSILLVIVALGNQYFVRRAKVFGRRLAISARAYSTKTLEVLNGIRLIKTVGAEKQEFEQIKTIVYQREKAEFDSLANNEIVGPINELSGLFIVLSIVLVGRFFLQSELAALEAILLTYLILLFRMMPEVSRLNRVRSQFANNLASIDFAMDLLRRENKSFMTSGTLTYSQLKEGIKFDNVRFSYPGHSKVVLDSIDLWIPKGKTVALVGSSGAGKSTIADLLPRLYDPTSGKIYLDGVDIHEYDLISFRQKLGVVSQDTFLFNATLRQNIAYGLRDVKEEDIIEASRRANALEFIEKMPKGLDTQVGDRGVILSGGQRQRVAIARALLRNPDILILDEATSALDTVSERLVQGAIDELCRDRTTLVIAHRLSTVHNAHQIVVLDSGKVAEVGNHQELLIKGGLYAKLYSMQFAETKAQENAPSAGKTPKLQNFERSQLHLSHQARTNLSVVLGSLQLLSDEFYESREEELELIDESYTSAMGLLKTIEQFEENTPEHPVQWRI